MKKLSTVITEYNDGMDSPRNYKLAVDMLRSHPYRNARLYHIVFTGSENKADYAWAIDSLTRKLRAAGMPVMYKGCYERDAKKRFHAHYFILVEAADHVPCTIIRYAKDGWLTGKLAERKLAFNISRPLAPMHGNRNYANVPKKASPKLADSIVWISYLYKVRSKDGVAGQKYVSSKDKATPATPTTTKKEDTMILTTAQNYVAGLYEQAVDAGYDVHAIAQHLAAKGIARTPGQLRYDMDILYGFHGYYDSHPAPAVQDVAAMDKAIDQMTAGQLKLYDLAAPVQLAPLRKRVYVSGLARRQAAG